MTTEVEAAHAEALRLCPHCGDDAAAGDACVQGGERRTCRNCGEYIRHGAGCLNAAGEWSGGPDPEAPDEAWRCDVCGERIDATCTECHGSGWGVFDADDERGLHIERCDSCGRYADDIAAENAVRALAQAGGREALDAIEECAELD